LRDVRIIENPPIVARLFTFQYVKTKQIQVVLYWYETSIFIANNTSQQKHVKISLIAYPESLEEVSEIEQQMTSIAKAIADYWQPIKTWTRIAITISQNGSTLTLATATTIALAAAYMEAVKRRTWRTNRKIYEKLSKEDKLILEAVNQASKEDKPNTEAIAKQYQKLTGKPIKIEQLIEKLEATEKIGLTRREIANIEDEPTLTWKNQTPIQI
jgi:hypothetical protein